MRNPLVDAEGNYDSTRAELFMQGLVFGLTAAFLVTLFVLMEIGVIVP